MKNEQNTSLQEGYRALGSQKSIGDHVPQVKIVIEHSRKLREGEQRFRSIDRIFIENTVGERILTPVKEASLARVFARLIAEGDLPHGVRWQHLENLTEDFKKIRDFVRATRGQITENRLVGLGRTHYIELKETLTRLAGHKGYNKYFEGWEPSKDDGSKLNMEKLYETGGDPRILEAMPILYKIQQQAKADEAQYQAIVESRGIARLEAWADSVISDYLYENEQPEESDIEVSAKMPGGGTISTETDLEEGEEAEIFSSGRGSKWDRPEDEPAYRRKDRGEQLDLRDLGIDEPDMPDVGEPDMPDVGEPDMPDFDGMDIPAYMRKASGKNFPGSIKEEEKMANKDWDGDGQIESEKDEVWGSRAAAAARAGKPFGK